MYIDKLQGVLDLINSLYRDLIYYCGSKAVEIRRVSTKVSGDGCVIDAETDVKDKKKDVKDKNKNVRGTSFEEVWSAPPKGGSRRIPL